MLEKILSDFLSEVKKIRLDMDRIKADLTKIANNINPAETADEKKGK